MKIQDLNLKNYHHLSKEIVNYPVLKPEEELDMFIKFNENDDLEAKNILLFSNVRLAIHISKKFVSKENELDDLIQEAIVALENAIDHFDYKRGVKFATYAYQYIQWAIKKSVFVKKSHNLLTKREHRKIDMLIEAKQKLTNINGFPPTEEQLVEYFKDTEFTLSKIRQIEYNFYSIFTKEESVEDLDLLQSLDQGDKEFAEQLKFQNESELLLDEINKLSDIEIDILKRKFGLDGFEPSTLQQIADIYGVSKERIRQIKAKALFKLERQLVKKID